MNFIDKLEKRLGRYAVENLTYYLIGGQVLSFLLISANPLYSRYFILVGNHVLQGQWWLLLTFLFNPISSSLFFAVFVWYIFYLYGMALERRWGSFRYLIYLLLSYVGIIIVAFIFPDVSLSNTYMYTSLFLAFAALYPDFQLLLFFIIPVKIKWLAILAWIGIIGAIILGSISTKVLTVVSLNNFLFFFYTDIIYEMKRIFRYNSFSLAQKTKLQKAYHICTVCGDNERDNPDMQIRYCSTCIPSMCYCGDHIKNHVRIRKPN